MLAKTSAGKRGPWPREGWMRSTSAIWPGLIAVGRWREAMIWDEEVGPPGAPGSPMLTFWEDVDIVRTGEEGE